VIAELWGRLELGGEAEDICQWSEVWRHWTQVFIHTLQGGTQRSADWVLACADMQYSAAPTSGSDGQHAFKVNCVKY